MSSAHLARTGWMAALIEQTKDCGFNGSSITSANGSIDPRLEKQKHIAGRDLPHKTDPRSTLGLEQGDRSNAQKTLLP